MEASSFPTKERMAATIEDIDADNAQLRVRIAELEREVSALQTERYEAEQLLGKALGYPFFYPDASPLPDGSVCIGEHVLTTIAAEAANKIASLALYKRRWETVKAMASSFTGATGATFWEVQPPQGDTFEAAVDDAGREQP